MLMKRGNAQRNTAWYSFTPTVVCLTLIVVISVAFDSFAFGNEILLDERDGMQVLLVPEPSPAEGLVAGRILLRLDQDHPTTPTAIVTFSDLSIRGNVRQVFLPDGMKEPTATPRFESWDGGGNNDELIQLDTHLMLTQAMIGGGAGGGFEGITETPGTEAPGTGLPLEAPWQTTGDLHQLARTDAFYLDAPFQSSEVELAYVVASDDFALHGETQLSLAALLKYDAIDCSCGGGGHPLWSEEDPLVIFPLVPEPSTRYLVLFGCLMLSFFRRG